MPSNDDETTTELSQLMLDSRRALNHIWQLVTARRVNIRNLGEFGWGQWLSEPYRIEDQWGRYGSSAGVQILAMIHNQMGDGSWEAACTEHAVAVDELFPAEVPPIPEHGPESHEPGSDDPDPWKHRDFAQPMKVAFCVDALSPHLQGEVQGGPPKLVQHLINQRLPSEACWSTRPSNDQHRLVHDRVLVSAFSLFALRRFHETHKLDRIAAAYRWLANQADASELGVDVHALCGIALCGATGAVAYHPAVKGALKNCDERLRRWTENNPMPILTRPWFNPYVDGKNIDYMFLSPEIVVALYFLKRGVEARNEAYVHTVVRHLTKNVNEPEGDQTPRGYRVQASLEGTVDQLWATRLLDAFATYADERLSNAERGVVPVVPGGGVLQRTVRDWRRRAVGVAAAGGMVMVAIVAGALGSSAVVAGVAGVVGFGLSKFLEAALDPVVDRIFNRAR